MSAKGARARRLGKGGGAGKTHLVGGAPATKSVRSIMHTSSTRKYARELNMAKKGVGSGVKSD